MEAKQILALIMGFVENVLFSGVCHGWPSMVFVLKEDGIFAHLCENVEINRTVTSNPLSDQNSVLEIPTYNHEDNNTTGLPIYGSRTTTSLIASNVTCAARDRILNLAYTLGVTCMMTGSVGIGQFFDKFGIRKLKILASCLFIPGCLLLGFADKDRSWMIFPGVILISVAGACIILTNYNVTLMAGSKKFTLASLYSGGTDISTAVFLIVKILWEAGVSRKVSLGVLTGLWSIVIIDSFVLFPKFKVVEKPKENSIDMKFPVATHHDLPSLRECLSSPVYITHCLWIALLNLRMVCFFASFNPWISEVTGGDVNKVSRLTDIFSYVMFCGILFNPLIGLAIDWCKKRLFSSTNDMSRNAFAAMPVLYIHSVIVILLSTAVLIPRDFFVYISYFLFVVFRSGLFAIFYSFFNLAIPGEYYGLMLGIATAGAGISTLIQFPLFIWAERSTLKFTSINILLLVVSVLCMGHPTCICLMNRKKAKKNPSLEMTSRDSSHAETLLGIKAEASSD